MDTKQDNRKSENSHRDEVLKVLDRMTLMDKCICLVTQFMYTGISLIYDCIHPESLPLLQSGSMAEGCALPRFIKTNEMEMDVMAINFDETGWLGTIDVENNPGFVHVPCDMKKLAEYKEHAKKRRRPGNRHVFDYQEEFPYTCLSKDEKFVSPDKRRIDINTQREQSREIKVVSFFSKMFIQLLKLDGLSVADDIPKLDVTKASVEEEVRFHKEGFGQDLRIIIDTTASMAILQWPAIAKEWVDRTREWPPTEEIKRIAAMGCHVVPKTSPKGDPDKEWRYSFSNAELELIRLQSNDQRRLYMLFKNIYYTHIKDCIAPEEANAGATDPEGPPKDPGLRSYSLKTIMLLFCEQHSPSEDVWKPENIFEGIRKLFETYKDHIDKGVLQNYFISSQNIISGVPINERQTASEIIEKILNNLPKYMPDMSFIEDKLMQNALLKEATNKQFIEDKIRTADDLLRKAARVLRDIYTERMDINELFDFLEQQFGENILDTFKDMDDTQLDTLSTLYKHKDMLKLAEQLGHINF